MSTPNDNQIVGSGHGILVVVAAPVEANAVRVAFGTPERSDGGPDEPWKRETLAPGFDLIVTGVGKAQAAGGTAWAYDPARHRGVVSIGIGGALPAREPACIGDTVLASFELDDRDKWLSLGYAACSLPVFVLTFYLGVRHVKHERR